MSVYTPEERTRVRAAVKRLADLEEKARNKAERGILLSTDIEHAIRNITKTEDPSRQIDMLAAGREGIQQQHIERLYPLAANEFGAFCEVMNPDEPPESPWHVWLCNKLQEIEVDPHLNRFILNCPPGHAKPLHVDTPVLMGDGSWKRLADVEVGDEVVSEIARIRKVTAVHQQGVLPLLKITTAGGRVIRAAPDHSFRVGSTWKQAQDLNPGDPLDVVGEAELEPWGEVDPDLVELAAWWVAYGTVGMIKSGPKAILNPHLWVPEAVAELARDAVRRVDPRAPIHPVRGSGGYAIRLAPSRNQDLIGILGLDRKAEDRRLPDFLFTAPREAAAAFLGRFLSERAECPKRYARPHLVCYMRSELLAVDLQRLLARFGVPSEVERPRPGFGGRPSLIISPDGIAVLKSSGVVYDGPYADRIAVVPASTLKRPLITDQVRSVETDGTGECRCLTVAVDHTFLAEGVVVHNSTYASRLYVVWRMGRNPNLQVIGGGHGQTFVENEFSYKNRQTLRSAPYQRVFPGVVVDHTKSAKGQWALAGHKGQYVAKGVGQGVHGFRANFIVVDDPYAKVEDAESATHREKVKTWFITDIGTRLLPGGKIFLIMTRFHEEDLTGTLLELNKEFPEDKRYYHAEAPAICYDPENDILGRRLGEVLWDFYPISEFIDKRVGQKYQRYALIYQQIADASSDESISGHFKYYKRPPYETEEALAEAREAGHVDKETGRVIPQIRQYFRRIIVSVDTASKDNERADFTVAQVWGQTGDHKNYLLDQKREKVEFTNLIGLIERLARRWNADAILVEDKGNGTSYIQARQPEGQRRLAPCPIVPIKTPANQGKVFRFDEVTPLIEAGEVYLPEEAEWLDLFIREVGQFPEGNKDDQVDAMSQALRYLKGKKSRYGSKKVKSHG